MNRRSAVLAGLALAVVGAGVLGMRGWQEMRIASLQRVCRQARETGRWIELEHTAVDWAAIDSRVAEPFLLAAEAAVAQGAIDRAAAHLDGVPDDDPKAVAALLHRVDMLFGELASPFEAAATCRRVLAIDPACGPAHQRLIFFYAVTLQRTHLAAQAREAIAAGGDIPETYVYLFGSDWLTLSNATEVIERWLEAHPDEPLFLVAHARGDLTARGLDDSIDDGTVLDEAQEDDAPAVATRLEAKLQALRERFPDNPELLAYYLQKASTAGDATEVARLLALVPGSSRDDNRFWRFKGWLHMARGEIDQADDALGQALHLNPFDFAARHLRADVWRKAGRLEDATRQATLAAEGRRLRRAILEQPQVGAVAPAVLERILHSMIECGDRSVAGHLAARVGRRPSAFPVEK